MAIVKIGGTPVKSMQRPLPLWSELHLQELYKPQWFAAWKARVPQVGCNCLVSFDEILETFPEVYGDADAQFLRGIDWHNAVSRKPQVNHPEISYELARTLWRHQRPATGRTRCIVTVATGSKFRELLEVTRPSLKSYAEKCNADFIELTNQTELWWGLEKFRARHFVEQYEETLFVDADCVINPNAPSIFGRSESLALHDDYSMLNQVAWIDAERSSVEGSLGLEFERRDTCLNSGVVYSRRDAAGVWKSPGSQIATSHTAEQIFVEQSAFRIGYENLDSRWNWQFYFRDFWKHAADALIVHFATSNEKRENATRMLKIWGEQT